MVEGKAEGSEVEAGVGIGMGRVLVVMGLGGERKRLEAGMAGSWFPALGALGTGWGSGV
jgi:hypothetical protein